MTNAFEPSPDAKTLAAAEADMETAAHIVGVSFSTLQNWANREKLLRSPGKTGRGNKRPLSVLDIFRAACVRAAVDGAGVRATVAVDAFRIADVWPALMDDRPVTLCLRDGKWLHPGSKTLAEITVRPGRVWAEMAPRFAQKFPEAAAAMERILTARQEMRQRQGHGE